MKNQLEILTDLASELIVTGKATIDNAFEMALEMSFKSLDKMYCATEKMQKGLIDNNCAYQSKINEIKVKSYNLNK